MDIEEKKLHDILSGSNNYRGHIPKGHPDTWGNFYFLRSIDTLLSKQSIDFNDFFARRAQFSFSQVLAQVINFCGWWRMPMISAPLA
jgi:hypothetical protein